MPGKILIVEDEPNIIVPLQFLMEQNGFEALVATSGEEAMDSISINLPDVVLLDIMLPGIDGFQVCQMVRDNPSLAHTKIVFVSAMGRDMDVAKGLALGADAYITKPFSNAMIVSKVKELIAGS